MAGYAVEFLTLFFVCPTVFAFTRHRIPAIPALWVVTAYCLFVMLRDPGFERKRLWDASAFWQYAPAIVVMFAIVSVAGAVLVQRFAPDLFLNFPRTNPRLWGLVMVLYPILSVYPQGIVYRAFIIHRYQGLLGLSWLMVLVSAIAFAYVHIVFRNALAVVLTFGAGLLFAGRYLQTGSLFVSSFEHALYGCAIFTIGLGQSFYYGAVRR